MCDLPVKWTQRLLNCTHIVYVYIPCWFMRKKDIYIYIYVPQMFHHSTKMNDVTHKPTNIICFVCLMVFNATFNNISIISWRSVLLVEETGGPGENHRPVASHWSTLSHNVVHLAWMGFELTTLVVVGTDCTCSCKSNYHTITATTAPGTSSKL